VSQSNARREEKRSNGEKLADSIDRAERRSLYWFFALDIYFCSVRLEPA
jgi:hypothetical protein